MRIIKTLLALAGAILLLLAGILLAVNNQQPIVVDLVFVKLPEASIATWLIAAFLVGALFSFLLGGAALLVMRARLGRAERRFRKAERELDNLRTSRLTAS